MQFTGEKIIFKNMLDPQEIKQFQEIVQETVRGEIYTSENRLRNEIIALELRMTKKINEAVEASEKRMSIKITEAIEYSEKRTQSSIKQLGIDIGDFITNAILPQIQEKASQKDLDKLAEKNREHEIILKKVKAGFVN